MILLLYLEIAVSEVGFNMTLSNSLIIAMVDLLITDLKI